MRFISTSSALLITLLAANAVCPLAARADAQSDLSNAVLTTLKAPSYHMTIQTAASGTQEGDYVRPGRMHMVMKNNVEVIAIDQTMYMKQNGTWRKFAGANIMKSQSNPLQALADAKGKYTVDDLGPRVVGGAPLHGYKVTNLQTKKTDSLFVDGSQRIVRIESGQDVIQMSKFGEPITIVAPM